MDLLTSIKGIGVTLAAALIVATGGFTYFDNAKQLTRYLGLSPIYQQFGTSVNVKGHINQNGDSNLRSQLYVAASRHSGVMPSARLVSTVCGLTASQARWRSLLSPTNL